ncbi:MAG TPA: glycosyltransferase family 2 protein [Vicinamibacterales bacterium]|nr:glycosyltransferase family 2 protein [Vicinamibacterales bacterium]
MAEITFWVAVGLVFYAYIGYPLALLLLSRVYSREAKQAGEGRFTPSVSFIIAVHNEEERIRSKIENTLAQDYPRHLLEIIVASDCSTDCTDGIVEEYSEQVRLVRALERRGKEAAQELAVRAARGDILIFSDAATAIAPYGISRIVRNFSDPTVGCVSSIDRSIDGDTIAGESAYVRYEMFLRTLETRVCGVVGLSGSFFAARREVCRRWAADRQSDFNTVLRAAAVGLRSVLDQESVGYYRNVADPAREFQRKVRTVVRGMAVLASNLRLLNPFRYGLFAWELASHKLCRWLVPLAMIAALLLNVVLFARSPLYQVMLILQLSFYAAALVGVWTGARALRLPAFLCVANAAVLTAWLRFLRGDRFVSWNPSHRIGSLPSVGSR